jgi:hypothetical protein
MSVMTMAANDAMVMHHDLLIELGRIDMALDSLDTESKAPVGEDKVSLRERLRAHRSRINEALQRLDA